MKRLFIPLLLALSTLSGATAPRITFMTYHNARFGFRVSVPRTLKAHTPSTNDDGRTFTNASGFQLTVWGRNNIGDATLATEMREQRADFDRITYSAKGANWFVLSGHKGRQILYRKVYVGSGSLNILALAYPAAKKTAWDQMVTLIVKSFKHGDLTNAH